MCRRKVMEVWLGSTILFQSAPSRCLHGNWYSIRIDNSVSIPGTLYRYVLVHIRAVAGCTTRN
eukprot:scaffold272797_cov45-Attheya_sp.AAC.1